ncbi:MAG TPA: translation initiation factor [Chitinophagaceae bacterium]|nr:translation initiation factor [Chitinophagaceae bacterium]
MAKKNQADSRGFVYSTNPDFPYLPEGAHETATLPAAAQPLRILLDKKQRAGKLVTLVTGFTGTAADLEELGRKLRNLCGAGGSAKQGEILVQGDHRDKVLQWLLQNGYQKSRKI